MATAGNDAPGRRIGRECDGHARRHGRHRLARLLRRPGAARADRARARQQSGSACRGAEHRARARAIPHPARRSVPFVRRRRCRDARRWRRLRATERVQRQPRYLRLRARLLRTRARFEPLGARAILRAGRDAAHRATESHRRSDQCLPDACRGPGVAAGRASDVRKSERRLPVDRAATRARRGQRARPQPGAYHRRECACRRCALCRPDRAGYERPESAGRRARSSPRCCQRPSTVP